MDKIPSFNACIEETIKKFWELDALTDYKGSTLQYQDVARRIVDFISGAVYGLDGNIHKISNSIFLVAPFNYEITNEVMKEDIKNKLSVSWIK